jgi:hypothetical protein
MCVRFRFLFLFLAGLATGLPRELPAQQPAAADADGPQIISLTVLPAAEPRPALKYRLLPAPRERTPGNAAVLYYRAILQVKSLPAEHWNEHGQKSEAWLAAPLDQFPKEEVRKWLGGEALFAELRRAVYREQCDWDLRADELRGLEPIQLLLEDAQQCRNLARKLQLKARLEISEGRYADALETLRHGYQLGQDVAKTPLLINGLVGIAITAVMNGELLKLIEASDVNYYWAIAALPRPVFNMRPAMEFEMNMPYQIFPFLKDAESAERTPQEWQQLIAGCLRLLPELSSGSAHQPADWQAELLAAAAMAKLYPPAKERLIAGGMPREKVEAMPVGQVVAIHTSRSLRYSYEEIGKLFFLPPGDAVKRSAAVEKRLMEQGLMGQAFSGDAGLPLAELLLPAVGAVNQATLRIERERSALQAIEALRMHAAQTGKLPASLADVTVVPVPNDPATEQPFAYAYDAAKGEATLDSPALPGQHPRGNAKRYVIRLRK